MNRRQQESIEVRVARVGGEMADLLDKVREHLPAEYDRLMTQCRSLTDEMRRIRRVAEEATR